MPPWLEEMLRNQQPTRSGPIQQTLGGQQPNPMGSLPPVDQFPQMPSGPIQETLPPQPPRPINNSQEASQIIDSLQSPGPQMPVQQNDNILQMVQGQNNLPNNQLLPQMLMSQMNKAPEQAQEQPTNPLIELLSNRPQREDHERGTWGKILASILGGVTGYASRDPMAGYNMAHAFVNQPYTDAMTDWQTDLSGAFQKYQMDTVMQQQLLDYMLGQQADSTTRRGQDVDRFGHETDLMGTMAGVDQRANAANQQFAVGMDRNNAYRANTAMRERSFDALNSLRRQEQLDDLMLGQLRAGSAAGRGGGLGIDDIPALMQNYQLMYGEDAFPTGDQGNVTFGETGGRDFFGNPKPENPLITGAQRQVGGIMNNALIPQEQDTQLFEEYLRRRRLGQ